MAEEDLAQTLGELLAFIEDRRETRTWPDGRTFVRGDTRRLTADEIGHVFVLDQTAGVQARRCGLRLPAVPAETHPRDRYLPCTGLRYWRGPHFKLDPTCEWRAEIKAIRAVAQTNVEGVAAPAAAQEERPPEEHWMPAAKAVERVNQEDLSITLATVCKWRDNGKPGLKARERTLPGRHRWEVEYSSLVLVCHQSAVAARNIEPSEGSFDERIARARAARARGRG
jgi:hypothetical protein